jgi:DNA-binding NtrC family response regulator
MSTILLVDDDDGSRVTLSALLEDDGFAVRSARSCAEARKILSEAAAADLVLLDQHLGDGLGSDLVGLVRRHQPRAKIVLMSGSIDREGFPETTDGCFEKAGAFEDLVRLLNGLLTCAL